MPAFKRCRLPFSPLTIPAWSLINLLQSVRDIVVCVKIVFFWKVFVNLTSAVNNIANSPVALGSVDIS